MSPVAFAENGAPLPVVAVMPLSADGLELSSEVIDRMSAYLMSRIAGGGAYLVVPRDQIVEALVRQKVKSHEPCYGSCQISLASAVAATRVVQAKMMRIGSSCSLILDLYDVASETMERSFEVEDLTCDETGLKKGVAEGALMLSGMSPTADKLSITDFVEAPAKENNGIADPTGINWIALSGGTFKMGSEYGGRDEKPVRAVTVRPFEMASSETTVAQYRKCFDAGVCTAPGKGHYCNFGYWDRENHPMNCITWVQAKIYAEWAGGRLPTEAEWEFAARSGGRGNKYPWGNAEPTCSLAVKGGDSWGCGRKSTWEVCSRSAGNSLQGICDLAGNVAEWVQDRYHASYSKAPTDGTAWETGGSGRVRRGGSFRESDDFLRASDRSYNFQGDSGEWIGVRPVRDVPAR